MTRIRIVTDSEDLWLCVECADKFMAKLPDAEIIDRDANEYGEGCLECNAGNDDY